MIHDSHADAGTGEYLENRLKGESVSGLCNIQKNGSINVIVGGDWIWHPILHTSPSSHKTTYNQQSFIE